MSRPPKPEVAATWEPTASLVPWDKNPRKNDGRPVDELAANMQRFGFTAPILARTGTREIIAGHTRWKAATKIGMERVAVRFLDVTDAEAHAIALADNRLGELAGWDDDLLREVLAGLEADAVDLDGLGWTAEELEGVMGVGPEPWTPPEPRPAPAQGFAVVVDCKDEPEQQALWSELHGRGFAAKPVVV